MRESPRPAAGSLGDTLDRLRRRPGLLGLATAYGYAGLLGSGAWVCSIPGRARSLGVLAVGLLGTGGASTRSRPSR